jgi:AcrR family transcriptional regulator
VLDFLDTVREEAPAVTSQRSVRERRRAVAMAEILATARRHVAAQGAAALSLRAVARELGMTVQALYHYFPSKGHLLTPLIVEAYEGLAAAAEAGAGHGRGSTAMLVAAEGYRGWALENVQLFHLIYGTPLPNYQAAPNGATTSAARRISAVFHRALFDGYTADQLARADAPDLGPALRRHLESLPGQEELGILPAPAAALFISAWGHMHGLVVLEVFGHLSFIGAGQSEIFRMAMRNLEEDIRQRVPSERKRPLAENVPEDSLAQKDH